MTDLSITLNLRKSAQWERYCVRQADNGHLLKIRIRDGMHICDISGMSAALTARKPDGALVYQDCALKDGAFQTPITAQLTTLPGEVACEVRVFDAEILEPDLSQLKNDLVNVYDDYYHKEFVDITSELTITTGEYIVAKETDHNYNGRTDSWQPSAHSNLIPVVEGDKFKITTKTNTNCPCIVFMSGNEFTHANYVGYTGALNVVLTDEVITIPSGVSYAGFNTADYTNNPISVKKHEYVPSFTKEEIETINNNDFFNERRISELEKHNSFKWKNANDKYFVFVIDDVSEFLEPCYNLFHSKNVPLSSATILDCIDTKWSGTTHTVKELLDLIVADGGEVLMHYRGSLYLTNDYSVWYKKIVEDMIALRNYGYEVNGLITAGSTPHNTDRGQEFCQKYYLYSDSMGTAPQYSLPRKFLIGVNTLDDMKSYINSCMEQNGIYPICIHGNRIQEGDEPLATVENLGAIIDYIVSKGGKFSTYRDVYNSFASSTAEENEVFVNQFKLNLLDTNLKSTTLNGLTLRNNGDGTYTLNGTATARTIFRIGSPFTLPVGNYTLSNSIYNDKVVISLCTRNYASGEKCGTYRNEVSMSLSEPTLLYPSLNVESETVIDNVIIKLMLEKGCKSHPFVRFGEPIDLMSYIDSLIN